MSIWEKWNLAFNDRMPINQQIALQFSQAFARGDIKMGERIPSIREMSGFLKVNSNTVLRVYQKMEQDGLIICVRGKGYFFTENPDIKEKTCNALAFDSLDRFTGEMRALGFSDAEIIDKLTHFINKRQKE